MKRFILLLIMAALGVAVPGNARAQVGIDPNRGNSSGPLCENLFVPVDVPGAPDAVIYGELCMPRESVPNTVQLLVHGSNFNHFYWDWPMDGSQYSHVQAAINRGYATFNIDRLGTGWSSHPQGDSISLDTMIDTLHQIVVRLRSGELGGHAFSQVVYFGSSLTTVQGWLLAQSHPEDIDAYVLTGLMHFTRPSFFQLIQEAFLVSCFDPKFATANFDCMSYATTAAGSRTAFFFHPPTVSQGVLAVDELLKDVVPIRQTFESAAYVLGQPDPATSPSQAITVPTLIVIGEFDATACSGDGLVCTSESVRDFEAPFYRDDIVLDAYVVPETGHALTLHYSAPTTAQFEHDWLDAYVGN